LPEVLASLGAKIAPDKHGACCQKDKADQERAVSDSL